MGFVHVAETKFKSNRIDVRFVVPLDADSASKYALVFPVISRATKKYPSTLAVRVACEELYGASFDIDVGKRGDAQIIYIGTSFLSNKYAMNGDDILGGVLDLIRQMLTEPKTENGAFCSEYVESEKKILIDEELSKSNDKSRYAQNRLIEEMFEGEPFAMSENGTAEQISAVTPASLWEAYENLMRTARVEICAVGDMDGERVKNFFSELFSNIPRKPIAPVRTVAKERARSEVKYVRESQNVTQGKLSLGFAIGDIDEVKEGHILDVAVNVFGAGTMSKLFMNVREKLSLCYYCSANANSIKGYMSVNSGILFENEQRAVNEILVQLKAVQNGEITSEELTSAKKELINYYRSIFDGTGKISRYIFGKIMDGDADTPEEKISKISSVTKEQIQKTAKNFKLDTYYFLCGKESENE